jgi:hypothetical protein
MITYKEIEDVKVVTPDVNEVTLFNSSGTLAFKDESGEVFRLIKQSDLDAIEAAKPKVYRALLTQNGSEDAPVAIVLENTLGGNLVWTRTGMGLYIGTLTGAFTANKTFLSPSASQAVGIAMGSEWFFYFARANVDTLQINVNNGEPDGYVQNIPIEILVYP